jgi:hypothetical protein
VDTPIELSPLPKTWLIDIDGTIFRHNSHLQGADELLPGVAEFFARVPAHDTVVLMTARTELHRAQTCAALSRHGIRYTTLLLGLPVGERVLINDAKPSGLQTAYAVNLQRDQGMAPLNNGIRVVNK